MRALSEFLDYREFLREFCESRSEGSPLFSCVNLAGLVGMDPERLARVLQGLEHLSERQLPRFRELLGLEGSSADYFELLVRYGRWVDGETARGGGGAFERERKESDGRCGSVVR